STATWSLNSQGLQDFLEHRLASDGLSFRSMMRIKVLFLWRQIGQREVNSLATLCSVELLKGTSGAAEALPYGYLADIEQACDLRNRETGNNRQEQRKSQAL